MNEILIGVGLCLFFFICLFISGYIGYRLGNKIKAQKITEDEAKKIKEMEEGFNNVLNYDYAKAIGRR